MHRRNTLKVLSKSALLSFAPFSFSFQVKNPVIDLKEVRGKVNDCFGQMQVAHAPYGAYHMGLQTQATDLYASCDVAIARHIMGENLTETLSSTQKEEWCAYINSFQQAEYGSYTDRFNHSKLHANGMTIGALGVFGGKQKYPVKLYDDFNTIEKAGPWLEQINWKKQWSASHLFWGGIHCYSLSKACDKAWLDYVFAWLNENLDKSTGWWRIGTQYTDHHQPLGGSVHIIPIYQHHNLVFPYPKQVIDSVLALQLPNGRWLDRKKDQAHVMHYLELDALYALSYMGTLAPGYRKDDIMKSVNKYADLVCAYWSDDNSAWQNQHPHRLLSMVGTFGLLQKMLPNRFIDTVQWTDIFSDIQLYNTAEVERLSKSLNVITN